MTIDTPYFLPNPALSKTTFYAGSFGLFSFGMLFGVHHVLKKEKMGGLPALFSLDKSKLIAKENSSKIIITRSSIFFASKALGYGTLLCVGTFTGILSVFVAVTGVNIFAQYIMMFIMNL